VLPREEIYQRLWGYSMARSDRSVDVYVRRLRSKLERLSPDWRYIHTHIGIGYRCAAEPIEQPDAATDAASAGGSPISSRLRVAMA
jgi:DNA-binding winged helix-turn-helix (wHTH) protein